MRRLLAASAAALLLSSCARGPAPLVVASKPFTESEIVGEMIAQLAESDGVKVERRFYLGGGVCFAGLKRGDVDAYVEYTGTGLVDLLGEPPRRDPAEVFARVKKVFKKRWNLTWEPPLGFDNTYALVVRGGYAKKHGLETISDLKKVPGGLVCGFDLEFADRPDGWKGLKAAYGLKACREIRQMTPGLMYGALSAGKVDVISGYATDGRIASYGLKVLDDDEHFFPPYQAAPLLGPNALKKDPKLAAHLQALAGRIGGDEMRALNAEVDAGHRRVRDVARDFLAAQGLLRK
ncbi:MAG: glycine/betaine ABC transporter substrate-binding protein [Elusimicrobia bacterium]|nr:glycine/betaine ABC transporter substrate-binding protein [Elusimicrobiota bacterium]